jgi:crossover junction endodeoxyribonuclease RusA
MSELLARCSLDGDPIPQGSVKAFAFVPKGGGRPRASVTSDNPRLRDWRADLAHAARTQGGHCFVSDWPVLIVARFRLPRPKSAKKSASGEQLAAKKPDIDKLARAVLDALTHVWLRDDSLVIELACSKRVCELGERPGVDIELWRVTTSPAAQSPAPPRDERQPALMGV